MGFYLNKTLFQKKSLKVLNKMVFALKTIVILCIYITISFGVPSKNSRRLSRPLSRQYKNHINRVIKSTNELPKWNKDHYNGKGYKQFLQAIRTSDTTTIDPADFSKYVKQVQLSNEKTYTKSKQYETSKKDSKYNEIMSLQDFKHKQIVKPNNLNFMIELVKILNKEENSLSNKRSLVKCN